MDRSGGCGRGGGNDRSGGCDRGGSNDRRGGGDRTAGGGHGSRAAEAEDVMGHYGRNKNNVNKNKVRTGIYYSPPGTSYTILEKPPVAAPPPPPPRATYLRESSAGSSSTSSHPGTSSSGGNRSNNAGSRGNSGKKRPISPEQVLKMFSPPNYSMPQSSSYHATSSVKVQPPPRSNSHGPSTSYSHKTPSTFTHIDNLSVRTISMSRPNPTTGGSPSNQGFGICVKGGVDESNVGVYISRVEEGSIAESVGLKPGDSILEVNGRPFTNISHDEALKILKSYNQITMTVKCPLLPQEVNRNEGESGNLEDQWRMRRTYSWLNRKGQPVSPPLEYSKPNSPYSKWSYTRSSKDKIRKVELVIEHGQSLGLMIRGGSEYNLGIFITGIDNDSVASRSGLMVGDQILEVNGQSFLNVSHDEAVNLLKFQNHMTLTVRDVGKVPHLCTTYNTDTWNCSLDNTDNTLKLGTSAASQMVEEKARVLLSKNEFNTLRYYLDEYSCSRMSIDAFITILFELLNTTDKFTLLTELRELIGHSDKDRFDQLVYRRGRESRKPRCRDVDDGFGSTMAGAQSKGFDDYTCEGDDMIRSASADYPTKSYRSLSSERKMDVDRSPMKINSRNRDMEIGEFEFSHQDYGDLETELLPRKYHSDMADLNYSHRNSSLYDDTHMTRSSSGYLEGLRSHLGGWTQKLKSWYYGSSLQLSGKQRSYDDGNNEPMDDDDCYRRRESGFNVPSCSSSHNDSLITLDQQGNLRITVKKIKPLLGIAIEGGINTKHLLPRIINIHENGAAYEAGGLEVGQLILEVDGQKVEGMPHQEVARLIAESFAQTDKSEIEFLVVEAKKSNLEPKPTALIFMEN
ncbi:uncharacterized protein LOC126837151 [Adelges cooleyi]|uniref:uncharacterized protein LOC126837151 n=1 Tax=Adelges cooleyi TaxID=133065 RepID=UPI00217F5F2B|nr:uncharacterized protein LOC126837151 [Adelges cooleyi]